MKPHEELKVKLGKTIRQFRESFRWTQAELAERLGWSSHVIVGNVESGSREIKASELALLSHVFKVSVDRLLGTEPAQEERFVLWREVPADDSLAMEQNAQFLEACDRYSYLENALYGTSPKLVSRELPSFSLDIQNTTYAEVADLAERTRESLNLGAYPASDLMRTLEEDCDVKIVYLSLPHDSGSAACSVLGSSRCIMLNAREVPWRRNFSLAHELFHLITWNRMLFAQLSENASLREKNEKLANAFAAALLMPQEQTRRYIDEFFSDDKALEVSDLLVLARRFEVSLNALLWRLVGLKTISSDVVHDLLDCDEHKAFVREANEGRNQCDHYRSWKFVRMAYQAHSHGRLSKAKLAQFLDVPLVDVYDELKKFGLAIADEQKIPISDS